MFPLCPFIFNSSLPAFLSQFLHSLVCLHASFQNESHIIKVSNRTGTKYNNIGNTNFCVGVIYSTEVKRQIPCNSCQDIPLKTEMSNSLWHQRKKSGVSEVIRINV